MLWHTKYHFIDRSAQFCLLIAVDVAIRVIASETIPGESAHATFRQA